MKEFFITLFWQVGYSFGDTQIIVNAKDHTESRAKAREYFKLHFEPYGYKLITLSH